jgi:hypothetical protein
MYEGTGNYSERKETKTKKEKIWKEIKIDDELIVGGN